MCDKADTIPASLAFCLILIFCNSVLAQKETGVILGTITYEGESLAGVRIAVSGSSLIGTTASTSTGEQGFYRFPILPPGTYDIKVESPGFHTIIRKDVRLFVGNSLTIDFGNPRQLQKLSKSGTMRHQSM